MNSNTSIVSTAEFLKTQNLSIKKLQLLLEKSTIEEATALRRYDFFNNLIQEIKGGKAPLKTMLENIFKDLDNALLSNPRDSKFLLQNVLQVLAQHITEPEKFLKSISFTRMNRDGKEGFFLKIDDHTIMLDRFFSAEFFPKGVFVNTKAVDLKLNPETIHLIITKVQALKSFQKNEIKDLKELRAGDIVVFVRNKRNSRHLDPVGRGISFLNALADRNQFFGHNRSTHAAIVVQGAEIAKEQEEISNKDVHVAHMVGEGYKQESLEGYFDNHGENRTLFVFRPTDPEMTHEILHQAKSIDNINFKYSIPTGAKVFLDRSSGKRGARPLSPSTVCSIFVSQCIKKSINKKALKEKRDIGSLMNTNMSPKKLEHWLILQSDLFTSHIYFGDRKNQRRVELKEPSHEQIVSYRVRSFAKDMNSSKFTKLLDHLTAEMNLEISKKEIELERVKLVRSLIADVSNEEEKIRREFLSRKISIAELELGFLKCDLDLRKIKNELFIKKISHESSIEEQNLLLKECVVFDEKKKKISETIQGKIKELEEFEKTIQEKGEETLKQVQIDETEEMFRELCIAATNFGIHHIEKTINSISNKPVKNFAEQNLMHLKELTLDNPTEGSAHYHEAVLERMVALTIQVGAG